MNPSDEDRRTHAQYIKDTGENMSIEQYCELRDHWIAIGGKFFGPNVEHGSIPESKLLPYLRSCRDAMHLVNTADLFVKRAGGSSWWDARTRWLHRYVVSQSDAATDL